MVRINFSVREAAMRNAFGIVCLVLGAGLVLAQVWASMKEAGTGTKLAEQAKAVKDAAQQTVSAATNVGSVASLTRQVLGSAPHDAQLRSALGTGFARLAADAGEAEAKAKAGEAEANAAKEKAEAAEKAASSWTVLDSLAGKVPLAVAGIVLIALGALIMNFIDLAAAASTG